MAACEVVPVAVQELVPHRGRAAHTRGSHRAGLLPRVVADGLARHRLRNALAVKGGPALRRCWFADYRFSEDLGLTSFSAALFGFAVRPSP